MLEMIAEQSGTWTQFTACCRHGTKQPIFILNPGQSCRFSVFFSVFFYSMQFNFSNRFVCLHADDQYGPNACYFAFGIREEHLVLCDLDGSFYGNWHIPHENGCLSRNHININTHIHIQPVLSYTVSLVVMLHCFGRICPSKPQSYSSMTEAVLSIQMPFDIFQLKREAVNQ